MLSIFDGLRDITLASVAFRLILSTLCGGIVGMEREFKRRSAGFRTHILICLGAAMTTLTSEFWLVYMRYYLDAARLGAGVVAGMGFIGAGTIIVTRRQRVKGSLRPPACGRSRSSALPSAQAFTRAGC